MKKERKMNYSVKSAITVVGTQRELARLCGVAQQTVSDWLRGKVNPSPRKAVAIEHATEGQVTRRDVLPDFPWG